MNKKDTKRLDDISEVLSNLLNGQKAEYIVTEGQNEDEIRQVSEYVNRLVTELDSLSQATANISNGNISIPISSKLRSAQSLKNLQATLKHLVWQSGQIAKGDFAQRTDFLGEFSKSFNWMVEQLYKNQHHLESLVEERTLELARALQATVESMAILAEKRDPYTAGHQRRVADIACTIARDMGVSQHQIEGIRLAGTIHDIGKMFVPAEILSKPGRLNEMEFGIIKMHSEAGYDILRGIEFPWPIAEMVFQHHERVNGSGYPKGLSDKDILLEAKILCVSDVVEAMSSHRPYRPAIGVDKALEEIKKNSGILYDSRVVDSCTRLIMEKNIKLE